MVKKKMNYKIYNGKSLKKYFENSKILLLTLLFSIGTTVGSITVNNNSLMSDKINNFINTYISFKTGQGICETFIYSLISNTVFIFVSIFLSFSLIGFTLIIWIPFLKGLGIGAVCGYFYSTYKLIGFGYCLLTIIPGATVAVFALISVCNSGYDYSKNAFLKSIFGNGQFEKGETKYFLIRQTVYILICTVSALIDALFSFIFSRIFEF
ncbi:MAG: stage II sporulation protein M [Clostridia bacterium]|nr:stage II sporulation protein M [Clostridia bacterium]